jgi:hypothetical protein
MTPVSCPFHLNFSIQKLDFSIFVLFIIETLSNEDINESSGRHGTDVTSIDRGYTSDSEIYQQNLADSNISSALSDQALNNVSLIMIWLIYFLWGKPEIQTKSFILPHNFFSNHEFASIF